MSRRSLRHGRTKKSQGQIISGRDDFILYIKILEWLKASEKAKKGFRSKNQLRTVLARNPENPDEEKDWGGASIDPRRFNRIINDLEHHGYVQIKKSLFGGIKNDIDITEDGKKLFEKIDVRELMRVYKIFSTKE